MKYQAADGIELFLPKLYDVVWSTIILVILAVFMAKYVMPKFNAVFDERARRIEGGMAQAAATQREAQELKQQYESQLSQARVQAAQIRDDARSEASHIVADARKKAEHEALQITEAAQRSIESQRRQVVESLKNDVGTLATALAGRIVGEHLQHQEHALTMVDNLIDQLEDEA